MEQITKIRKAVATMANQLHKLGYSLSQAFKTAWRRVKMAEILLKNIQSSLIMEVQWEYNVNRKLYI